MIETFNIAMQSKKMNWRTRFAPSPTGHLHLGHSYSALTAWAFADESPERFILRIDDLDHTRCRPEFTQQICDDLAWLGISWASPPSYQSKRHDIYATALSQLQTLDLVYPCYLSRAELSNILSAPHGPTKAIPSTRTSLTSVEQKARQAAGQIPAWRLDMTKAIEKAGPLTWTGYDGAVYHADPSRFGDVVIARRDLQASYHLSVVLDDMLDNVTLVVRGKDLEESTHLHRLLQALLGLPVQHYFHHDLVCDEHGKRLAKRDDARSLFHYKNLGFTPNKIKEMLREYPFQ